MNQVIFQPTGRRGKFATGISVRASARSLGVDIESICAENATCGKCKVIVEEGKFDRYGITSRIENLSPLSPEEMEYFSNRPQLLASYGLHSGQIRLACQAKVLGDILISIPEESRGNKQVIRKSAGERVIDIIPSVRIYLVEMNPPTLSNPKADWERLASGIAASIGLVRYGEPDLPGATDLKIDYECLKMLSDTLRDSNWRVTVSVWQDKEVIRVESGFKEFRYGAAIDIGTTTVALFLCNLENGAIVATESEMNPQIVFGEDVMSRIQYTISNPEGLEKLHKAIINSLNQLLINAAKNAGISTDDILELLVVGNTTMQHLFLNLTPKNLGKAPYVSAQLSPIDIKARELGLRINKSANVHALPTIGAFIGSDTTGVLLAEEPQNQSENWLLIDIGTNAELILGNKNKLICASTPTGPAFEGAHIQHGMRASPGAIEHIKINDTSYDPDLKIIGEDAWNTGRAKGICGSAIVDAVAELFRVGILDASGKFISDCTSPRLRRGDVGPEFVIAYVEQTSTGHVITLSQKDVRQLQLAKSALFVAAKTLLNQMNIEKPDKIFLSGAFGSFIDKKNAMQIGMIPDCPLENVFTVGNSAGDGARIALLNLEKRREAVKVVSRVIRYELPTDPEFQNRFMDAIHLPSRIENSIPDQDSKSISE